MDEFKCRFGNYGSSKGSLTEHILKPDHGNLALTHIACDQLLCATTE